MASTRITRSSAWATDNQASVVSVPMAASTRAATTASEARTRAGDTHQPSTADVSSPRMTVAATRTPGSHRPIPLADAVKIATQSTRMSTRSAP